MIIINGSINDYSLWGLVLFTVLSFLSCSLWSAYVTVTLTEYVILFFYSLGVVVRSVFVCLREIFYLLVYHRVLCTGRLRIFFMLVLIYGSTELTISGLVHVVGVLYAIFSVFVFVCAVRAVLVPTSIPFLIALWEGDYAIYCFSDSTIVLVEGHCYSVPFLLELSYRVFVALVDFGGPIIDLFRCE